MKLRYILLPFSLIYGVILVIRNKLFDWKLLKPIHFDIPVIGIGNLEVGGTGKTPHMAYLIEMLHADYKVAVLSRGYGRRSRGFRTVETDSLSREVGDEPLMLKQMYPDIAVAVCENRPMGVASLLQQYPETEVVLLDDVFQHRYIAPGYMILLSDYNRPFFKDFVLPAGNLREFRKGYRRADLVVFSKCPTALSNAVQQRFRPKVQPDKVKVAFTGLRYSEPRLVNGPKEDVNTVVLVTGIAKTNALENHLDERYAIIKHLKYRDHYRYQMVDVREMIRWMGKVSPSVLMTTAKDWVKLKPLFNGLSETTVFVQDIEIDPFDETIAQEVKSFISGFETSDD